jgi:hypothetical protein
LEKNLKDRNMLFSNVESLGRRYRREHLSQYDLSNLETNWWEALRFLFRQYHSALKRGSKLDRECFLKTHPLLVGSDLDLIEFIHGIDSSDFDDAGPDEEPCRMLSQSEAEYKDGINSDGIHPDHEEFLKGHPCMTEDRLDFLDARYWSQMCELQKALSSDATFDEPEFLATHSAISADDVRAVKRYQELEEYREALKHGHKPDHEEFLIIHREVTENDLQFEERFSGFIKESKRKGGAK